MLFFFLETHLILHESFLDYIQAPYYDNKNNRDLNRRSPLGARAVRNETPSPGQSPQFSTHR